MHSAGTGGRGGGGSKAIGTGRVRVTGAVGKGGVDGVRTEGEARYWLCTGRGEDFQGNVVLCACVVHASMYSDASAVNAGSNRNPSLGSHPLGNECFGRVHLGRSRIWNHPNVVMLPSVATTVNLFSCRGRVACTPQLCKLTSELIMMMGCACIYVICMFLCICMHIRRRQVCSVFPCVVHLSLYSDASVTTAGSDINLDLNPPSGPSVKELEWDPVCLCNYRHTLYRSPLWQLP